MGYAVVHKYYSPAYPQGDIRLIENLTLTGMNENKLSPAYVEWGCIIGSGGMKGDHTGKWRIVPTADGTIEFVEYFDGEYEIKNN